MIIGIMAMTTGLAMSVALRLYRELRFKSAQLKATREYLYHYMGEANRERLERERWERAYAQSLGRDVA